MILLIAAASSLTWGNSVWPAPLVADGSAFGSGFSSALMFRRGMDRMQRAGNEDDLVVKEGDK